MTTVSITKQPTYRLGPRTGIRCEGSVKSEDVEVTDDLLVHGDAEVVGTLYVGALSSGADVSTNHIIARPPPCGHEKAGTQPAHSSGKNLRHQVALRLLIRPISALPISDSMSIRISRRSLTLAMPVM